ncbi:rhodopsin-like [Penaeus monodon]|uniref:rhodopsin-like n=1 Tax=Penaeus monodon TaxID=6687 RepID=UPI0018A74271|nr:rhodopsin-like [Penaeus monodon]
MTPPLLVPTAYWGLDSFGAFFCGLAFLGSFFCFVSIWSMVFITADRYNARQGSICWTSHIWWCNDEDCGTWLFTLPGAFLLFFRWTDMYLRVTCFACGTDVPYRD